MGNQGVSRALLCWKPLGENTFLLLPRFQWLAAILGFLWLVAVSLQISASVITWLSFLWVSLYVLSASYTITSHWVQDPTLCSMTSS